VENRATPPLPDYRARTVKGRRAAVLECDMRPSKNLHFFHLPVLPSGGAANCGPRSDDCSER